MACHMHGLVQTLSNELLPKGNGEHMLELALQLHRLCSESNEYCFRDDDGLLKVVQRALALFSSAQKVKGKEVERADIECKRRAGGLILSSIARRCPSSFILNNYLNWCQQALDVIKSSEGKERKEAWMLLTVVFRRLRSMISVPGVKRDGASLVSKVIGAVQSSMPVEDLKVKSFSHLNSFVQHELDILNTLHAALQAFPASFRQHLNYCRNISEDILGRASKATYSDEQIELLIRVTLSFWTLLPAATGDSIVWNMNARRILGMVHSKIAVCYDDFEIREMKKYFDDQFSDINDHSNELNSQTHMTPLSSKDIKILTKQISLLISGISLSLSQPFPAAVDIPAIEILDLSVRLFSIAEADVLASQQRPLPLKLRMSYSENLPISCTEVLKLIEILLSVAGVRCIPFINTFGRCLNRFLETIKVSATSERSNLVMASPNVRNALYCAASALLSSGGIGAAKLIAPMAIECIYIELYNIKNAHSYDDKIPKNSFKKQRIAYSNPRSELKEVMRWFAQENLDQINCQIAALKLLASICRNGGSQLSTSLQSKAGDIAIHIAHSMGEISNVASQSVGIEVSNCFCLQSEAYRTALDCLMSMESQRSSHVSLLMSLLQQGLHSQSDEIKNICLNSIQYCEIFIHPRAIPMTGPLENVKSSMTATRDMEKFPAPIFWTHKKEREDLQNAKDDDHTPRQVTSVKETEKEKLSKPLNNDEIDISEPREILHFETEEPKPDTASRELAPMEALPEDAKMVDNMEQSTPEKIVVEKIINEESPRFEQQLQTNHSDARAEGASDSRISDSEGSLPEIDSGPESSCTS